MKTISRNRAKKRDKDVVKIFARETDISCDEYCSGKLTNMMSLAMKS